MNIEVDACKSPVEESLFDLLDSRELSKAGEGVIPHNLDTVRRYFSHGILKAHELSENAVTRRTYRGSALVRFRALTRLRLDGGRSRALVNFGSGFKKAGGEDDGFILDRLRRGDSVDAVTAEFVRAVREEVD